MKTTLFSASVFLVAVMAASAADLTINENWSANFDAAAWGGSSWSDTATTVSPTFLPTSLGGT